MIVPGSIYGRVDIDVAEPVTTIPPSPKCHAPVLYLAIEPETPLLLCVRVQLCGHAGRAIFPAVGGVYLLRLSAYAIVCVGVDHIGPGRSVRARAPQSTRRDILSNASASRSRMLGHLARRGGLEIVRHVAAVACGSSGLVVYSYKVRGILAPPSIGAIAYA